MKYPQEFIDKCKAVYPDWLDLHNALERGSEWAGRYLDDAAWPRCINADDVLNATNLDELKERARFIEQKVALYTEWGRYYDEWNGL